MLYQKFISAVFFLIFSPLIYADILYVSDIQFISIREGKGNTTKVIERGLKSGTRLDVLEQKDGFSKVRTAKGNEGWVADYYLTSSIVNKELLQKKDDEITQLQQEKKELDEKITSLERKLINLDKDFSDLTTANKALDKLTKNTQEIVERNIQNEYSIKSLQQFLKIEKERNETYHDTNQRQWFLLGAATLFIGLSMGILISLRRGKKSITNSW